MIGVAAALVASVPDGEVADGALGHGDGDVASLSASLAVTLRSRFITSS